MAVKVKGLKIVGELAGLQFGQSRMIWGITGGCGNSDQYQTPDHAAILFPAEAYGGWDLKENVKLTDAEVEAKKFARVVTRERSKDRR